MTARRQTGRVLRKAEEFFRSVPDDFLRGIGRVVVDWGHLEFAIHRIVAGLLCTDYTRLRVVVGDLAVRPMIRSLQELASTELDDRAVRELKSILKSVHELLDKRNRVVHDLWSRDGTGVTRERARAWGQSVEGLANFFMLIELESVSAVQLKELSQRIREIERRLVEWAAAHRLLGRTALPRKRGRNVKKR